MSEPVLAPVPWDRAAFGLPVWEIVPGEGGLEAALPLAQSPGLYTVRVDPRADSAPLHRHGFYYCDTQIQTRCEAALLAHAGHPAAGIAPVGDIEPLARIAREAFLHSHFHRDPHVERAGADRRFENWLRKLHADGKVVEATWEREVAGFFAHAGDGRLLLYATAAAHRGRGRSRHLFAACCRHVLGTGAATLVSAYSAANLGIANVHAALGFRATAASDIYHRLVA